MTPDAVEAVARVRRAIERRDLANGITLLVCGPALLAEIDRLTASERAAQERAERAETAARELYALLAAWRFVFPSLYVCVTDDEWSSSEPDWDDGREWRDLGGETGEYLLMNLEWAGAS